MDTRAARQVAERHVRAISYTLENNSTRGSREQAKLLEVLGRLSPDLITKAFGVIPDVEATEQRWTKVLQEGDALSREVVLRILQAAAATEQRVAQVAKRLLEKPQIGRARSSWAAAVQ